MLLKKRLATGATICVLLFSLIYFFTGKPPSATAGSLKWETKPFTKKIEGTEDTLIYGKLLQQKDGVAAVGREYKDHQTGLMVSTNVLYTKIFDVAIFKGFEKFSPENKNGQPLEMGLSFGLRTFGSQNEVFVLPIMDTTPKEGDTNFHKIEDLPIQVTKTATYKDDAGKKHTFQVYNANEEQSIPENKDAAVLSMDGTTIGLSKEAKDVNFVSAWWTETGIGDDTYTKLYQEKTDKKDIPTHMRPYALGYTLQKQGDKEVYEWSLWTPEYNGSGDKDEVKNLVCAYHFENDSKIAKAFYQRYLVQKDFSYSDSYVLSSYRDKKKGAIETVALENKQEVPVNKQTPEKSNDQGQEQDALPSLVITSPNEETIEALSDTITLKGTITGKVKGQIKYSIFVNGSSQATDNGETAAQKSWEIKNIKLQKGENKIVLMATVEDGSTVSDTVVVDYQLDADHDGLVYSQEIAAGTDPQKPDTDGDGLPDGYEVSVSGTSPIMADSDGNGIPDSKEDADKDGLTTIEEMVAQTNPQVVDTDQDGLNDGTEVKTYGTSPLKDDTDGDGLSDQDDLTLGFNPLKQDSNDNGIIDSQEKVEQKLDNNTLKNVLKTGNKTIPSITIKGEGNLNNSVFVYDASSNVILKTVPGIVGTPIDLKTTSVFDQAQISFTLDNSLVQGKKLDDYVIIWFDTANNKVVPLDTTYNSSSNTLTATTTHFSNYAVLDKAEYAKITDSSNPGSKIEKGKADVSFVIDSTGSMGGAIDNVKGYISSFVDRLGDRKVDVRLGLIDYKDINADGPQSTVNHGWFDTADAFKNDMNSTIFASGGGDGPESAVDALEEARTMGFQADKAKFVILLTDADFHEETRFQDLTSMAEEVKRLSVDNIRTSVIAPTYYESIYHDLYSNTNGIFTDIYSDFSGELDKLIDNIGTETNSKATIRLSTGQLVRLDKDPELGDRTVDSDGDGVADLDELTTKTNCYIGNGKFGECWSFKSHPELKNSDDDIYNDDVDLEPLSTYTPAVVFLHGWTANSWNTFGVKNKLDSTTEQDGQKINQTIFDKFSDVTQNITATDKDGNTKLKAGLYHDVENVIGSSANLYTFDYPNIAHPARSADILDQYLKNLNLKGPTKTENPKVILIAHSMGGLVSRWYNEKITHNSVDVAGIITIATPHWGANATSSDCIGSSGWLLSACSKASSKTAEQLNSDAAFDLKRDPLDPKNPVKYMYDPGTGYPIEIPQRIQSFTERLNEGFTSSTKKDADYYAVGGVNVISSFVRTGPVEVRYLENNPFPKNGDFIALATDRVYQAFDGFNAVPYMYDDIVVTLNSAFGSSNDIGDDGLHETNKVLDFDGRYGVIGKYDDAWHSALPNTPYTTNTVSYWLVNNFFSKYDTSGFLSTFTVNEPDVTTR